MATLSVDRVSFARLIAGDTRGGAALGDCHCAPRGTVGTSGVLPVDLCMCSQREGLGDVVCTPAEAEAARQAVAQLEAVFKQAGQPARFLPYVQTIRDDWKEYDGAIVFYTWCQAKEIGQRARALTAQIAAASGIAPPPESPNLDPGPTGALTKFLHDFGSLIVGAGVVYIGARAVGALGTTSSKPRRRARDSMPRRVRL